MIILLGHTQFRDGQILLPAALIVMDVFFCLSGFLITSILLTEIEKTGTISIRNFWINRSFRIFPAFYVYYFIGVGVYLITRFKPILGDDPTLTMSAVGLFWSNWATAFGHKLGIYTITWSLSTEEQFYLIAPVFFGFLIRKGGLKTTALSLLALIGVIIAYRISLFESTLLSQGAKAAWERCYLSIDTRADSLLIGCLGAILTSIYPRIMSRSSKLSWVGIVGILTILTWRDIPLARGISENSVHLNFMMYGGFDLVSLLSLFIILDLRENQNSVLSRFFSRGPFVKFGLMSFSIYLWHTTVFGGTEILLKSFNENELLWALKLVIRFSLLLVVGGLSYRFVEKPFHQYGKKLQNKKG